MSPVLVVIEINISVRPFFRVEEERLYLCHLNRLLFESADVKYISTTRLACS